MTLNEDIRQHILNKKMSTEEAPVEVPEAIRVAIRDLVIQGLAIEHLPCVEVKSVHFDKSNESGTDLFEKDLWNSANKEHKAAFVSKWLTTEGLVVKGAVPKDPDNWDLFVFLD